MLILLSEWFIINKSGIYEQEWSGWQSQFIFTRWEYNSTNFSTGHYSRMKGIMGSTSQTQLQSQENKVKSGLMLILSSSLPVFLELVVNGFIVSAH